MICNKESPKKVYIRTFGCQMNEYDTERMISILKGCEYISEEDPANADLIILNTCTVREKAAQKVYSMLGRFKKLKRENEDLIIGVGGCLAQQEGWKLVEKAPVVDMVFGPHTIPDLCKLVFLAESKEAKVIATNEAHKKVFSVETFTRGERATAFVSIMQGCDKYCSYCIVPYVRGREVSRSPEEILLEIRCLADSGVKEVTLLGQNVNSYGKSLLSGIRFSDLLYLVCNIEGIKRVRFVTSHPKDLDDDLIMAFSQLNKLCNHFHLPLQSGSNKILRAMGRHYTAEEYIEKVNKIRMVRPAIAITTDIIVGFPGEEEEDFEETIKVLNAVKFDNMFSFRYSDRSGTTASQMKNKIEEKVKAERLKILQESQKVITRMKNMELFDKTCEILVDGKGKSGLNQFSGRTSCNRVVNFPGSDDLMGKLIDVVIEKVYQNSLVGRVISC